MACALIAEGGRSEVGEYQVEQIKPDHVTLVAACDVSARGNQICVLVHSDVSYTSHQARNCAKNWLMQVQ